MPEHPSEPLDRITKVARLLLALHYRNPIHQSDTEEFRAHRAQCVHDAIGRRDWDAAITWLPRPYRPDFFEAIQLELPAAEYARLLADIWVDTELPGRNLDSWIRLFTNPRLEREFLMTPEELAVYRALPDPVQIWRGVGQPRYARGFSWTMDPERAAWFAKRFKGKGRGRIYSATVPREAILAYFAGRGEAEVVVDPRSLGRLRGEWATEAEAEESPGWNATGGLIKSCGASQEEVVEVERIVKANGLALARRRKPGSVGAFPAVLRVYRKDNGRVLEAALETLIAAFGRTAAAMDGRLIEGLGEVYGRDSDPTRRARLVKKLAKYPAGAPGLLATAHALAQVLRIPIWRAVAECVARLYPARSR